MDLLILLASIAILLVAASALAVYYSFLGSQNNDAATRWANCLRAVGLVRATLPLIGDAF
jgi:hypothetical protein